MHSILTFASIGLGLALTLLLGPQWGILAGLIAYLTGRNMQLSKELQRLQAQVDKNLNELPELVAHLLRQQNQPAQDSLTPTQQAAPEAPAPAEPVCTTPPVEQRISELDHKLDRLLHRLEPPATQAPAEPPESASTVQNETEAPPPALRDLLAKMDELLQLHAATQTAPSLPAPALEAQAAPAFAPPPPAAAQTQDPEVPPPSKVTGTDGARAPSIDLLRAELDKLTRELRAELGRTAH